MSTLLTTRQAGLYVHLSPRTLDGYRSKKEGPEGPPFIRLGRTVRYRVEDLDAWIESNRH
jgi:hypothetical protein